MTANEELILTRSTYSLKDVAKFAGLDVDDLLERHIREGDLDLYVKVPAGTSAYSLIRNYLRIKPPSIVVYPHLVVPQKHAEIEAVRLSHKDCVALVRFRKVEQSCFPAGLAAKSGETASAGEPDDLDFVLLRDRNFYPGQFEESDPKFGYGARWSERSLDAVKNGVTFRLNTEHGEVGGITDFPPIESEGRAIWQYYDHWFCLYPDPPAPAPIVDKHMGISLPETLLISESDVFVTRVDLREFLERFSDQLDSRHVTEDAHGETVDKLGALVEKHEALLGNLEALAGKHEAVVGSGGHVIDKHDALVGRLQPLATKHEALISSESSVAERHRVLLGNLETLAEKHDSLIENEGDLVARHEVLIENLQTLSGKTKSKVSVGVIVPGGLPPLCSTYSCPDLLQKSEKGDVRAVPRSDAPKMLQILFDIREAKWAVDWRNKVGMVYADLKDINDTVIALIQAEARGHGLSISEDDAREISYFVRPDWARSENYDQLKGDWSGTYETPEFLRLVSAACVLQDERAGRSSDHVNREIDPILRVADPVPISGKKLKYARMVVRYAPGRVGKPPGALPGEKAE